MESPYKSIDWKWLTTTVLALTIVGATMWMIRGEVSRLSQAIDSADRRMARVETALHILAGTQDEKTQRSVDLALTVAQNSADSATELLATERDLIASNDAAKAEDAGRKARTLILTARDLKTPAPPGFFAATTTMLDNFGSISNADVSTELFATRVALAEYHSALEPAPDVPGKVVELSVHPGEPIDSARLTTGAVYRPTAQVFLPVQASLASTGAVIDGSALLAGQELISPRTTFAQGNNSISGLVLEGVTQTLDGANWKDVVFLNARIRYRGGRLKLDHVRFVNCTFEVSDNDNGAKFARGVTLGGDALAIG